MYSLYFLYLDIFNKTPDSNKTITKAEPPWLIKGRGSPVSGKTPNIDAMFMKDWVIISITIPEPKSLPKLSGDLIAIKNPLNKKSRKRKIRNEVPIIPHSSPIIANMESPVG